MPIAVLEKQLPFIGMPTAIRKGFRKYQTVDCVQGSIRNIDRSPPTSPTSNLNNIQVYGGLKSPVKQLGHYSLKAVSQLYVGALLQRLKRIAIDLLLK